MLVAWRLIQMSIKEEVQKKYAFIFDRVIAMLTTVVFLSVWIRLTEHGPVAGFSQEEFITYTLLAHVIRPLVFLFKYRVMTWDIMYGKFALTLTLPVAVSWYYYLRSWGERSLGLLSAVAEGCLLAWVFDASVILPESGSVLTVFLVLLIGAHVLSEILAFTLNLTAFWTPQANGPRFLYDWIAEFMAGLYFPLWLLSASVLSLFALAPFTHFLYGPITVWLRPDGLSSMHWLGLLVWFGVTIVLATLLYRRGLKQYDAPGI